VLTYTIKNKMEKELEKEFVPYTPSLRLKALGFNKPCFRARSVNLLFYLGGVSSNSEWSSEGNVVAQPTFQCAFDWFREEHGYCSYIKEATKGTYRFYIEKFDEKFFNSEIYKSYDKARISCIEKLLEIVESKK